jgi:hypothetical protein
LPGQTGYGNVFSLSGRCGMAEATNMGPFGGWSGAGVLLVFRR